MSVLPTPVQLQRLAEEGPEGPIVMVNLLKFRARASYEAALPEARENLTGAEAYMRYGAVAQQCVAQVGGSIVWGGQQSLIVIGAGDQDWDQIVCVRYPSRQAFLKMIAEPRYLAASHHRTAGLERTALLCCVAGTAS